MCYAGFQIFNCLQLSKIHSLHTLPSLIVGGESITELVIFSAHFNLSAPTPQFNEILEISYPSHLMPTPQINQKEAKEKLHCAS